MARPKTRAVMLTAAQLRMARGAVGWSRKELADRSGTSVETIKNYEVRGSNPTIGTVNKWRKALIAAGVVFLEADANGGPGVRLKESKD